MTQVQGNRTGAQSSNKWKRNLGIAFSSLVSLAAIYWVVNFVGSQNLLDQLAKVEGRDLAIATVLTFIGYLLRAWRWEFFFDNKVLTFQMSLRCLFVGFFMNNVLPARMGEFVRAHVGGRAANKSRTTVLATIAGERLADGVTISAIFGFLFYFGSTAQERMEGQLILYVAALFGLASLCSLLVILKREWIFSQIERAEARFGNQAAHFALIRARRFIHGLEPMFRTEKLLKLIPLSIMIWSLELLAYAQVAAAFNKEISIGTLSLFLAAVNFSSLIPSAPGAVGVIEAFATLALHHVGVEKDVALAMVTTQHILQYLVVGVPGVIFFMLYFHGKVPHEEDFPEEPNDLGGTEVVA